jgi:hypothetical protein
MGRKKKKTQRLAPLPEAVRPDGRSWEIRNGRQSGVSFSRSKDAPHTLTAPLGPDPVSFRGRVEAMTAAKWSPVRRKVDPVLETTGLMDACERARLAYLGRRQGGRLASAYNVPTLPPLTADGRAALAAEVSKDPRTGAALAMASMGTADYETVADALRDAGPLGSAILDAVESTWAGTIRARRGSDPAPFANAVRAAEILNDLFGDDAADWEDPETIESMQDAERFRESMEGLYDHGGGEPRWTPLTDIVTPPMPLRLPARLRARKRRCSDGGVAPVAMHRWVTDGRVFRERSPRPGGGTVLVDVSGSMSLDAEDVLAIMEAMPAGTIATYCGADPVGLLTIVAKDGRRCRAEDLAPRYGGNECDLPALEWLNTQPGPRYWVTDGHVVAGGGGDHGAAVRQCADAARKGRVRILEHAAALVERLKD